MQRTADQKKHSPEELDRMWREIQHAQGWNLRSFLSPLFPRIVTLCGSTRFYEAFQRANYQETIAGRIILSVGHYPNAPAEAHCEKLGCTPEQKAALDQLHFRKIELSDEILVLNVGGYVGESTRNEVLHAHRLGKAVRWLEPFKVPADLAHIGDSLSDGPAVHRDRDNDPDNVGA